MDDSNNKEGECSLEGGVSSTGTMSSESGSFTFRAGVKFNKSKMMSINSQTNSGFGIGHSINSSDVEDSPLSEEEDKSYSYKSGNLSRSHYFSTSSNVSVMGDLNTILQNTLETSRLNMSLGLAHFCHYCDYSSKYRCVLREHLKTHEEHPYKCLMCGNVCSNNGNLKRHLMLHSGELPFKCSECNEGFKTNHYLNVHRLKHSGQRPFKCEHCPAAFIQRSHLKKHSLKHQSIVFKCSYCDFSSEFSKIFQNHVLSHTEKLSFRCRQCDYSCEHNAHFKEHMMKHSGTCSFTCHCCGFSFKSKSNLDRHLLKHSTQKKFKCLHCDYATNQTVDLQKHTLGHASERVF